MSEEEIFKLSDKNVIPTDDYIFSIIGEKKTLWIALMSWLAENYRDASGSWNFYNDGKQWVYKMTRKKKTIFWISLLKYTFKVTFYFGDKAEPLIESSDLHPSIKDAFKTGHRYGKIRAITIKMMDVADVESVKKVVAIKMKMK
jgi:hypothetical protein